MLCPSTRATWNPKVTMSVAYTAAEASVFSHATISSTTRSIRSEPPSIDRRVSGAAVRPPARAGTGSVETSGSGTLTASAVGGSGSGAGYGAGYAAGYGGCGSGGGAYGS